MSTQQSIKINKISDNELDEELNSYYSELTEKEYLDALNLYDFLSLGLSQEQPKEN